MSTEEYAPNWSGDELLKEGKFIWDTYINNMEFKDTQPGKEKPFMVISAIVEDPQQGAPNPLTGYDFTFRIYIHKKSRGWCQYFLKKFGYPTELLQNEQPILKRSEIVGTHGKLLVHVTQNQNTGMMNIDVKGFDYMGGTELEEKMAKEKAKEAGEEDVLPQQQAEQEIDVHADVRAEQTKPQPAQVAEGDWLDNLPDESPSVERPSNVQEMQDYLFDEEQK